MKLHEITWNYMLFWSEPAHGGLSVDLVCCLFMVCQLLPAYSGEWWRIWSQGRHRRNNNLRAHNPDKTSDSFSIMNRGFLSPHSHSFRLLESKLIELGDWNAAMSQFFLRLQRTATGGCFCTLCPHIWLDNNLIKFQAKKHNLLMSSEPWRSRAWAMQGPAVVPQMLFMSSRHAKSVRFAECILSSKIPQDAGH